MEPSERLSDGGSELCTSAIRIGENHGSRAEADGYPEAIEKGRLGNAVRRPGHKPGPPSPPHPALGLLPMSRLQDCNCPDSRAGILGHDHAGCLAHTLSGFLMLRDSREERRFIISSVIGGLSVQGWSSQPKPKRQSPMTASQATPPLGGHDPRGSRDSRTIETRRPLTRALSVPAPCYSAAARHAGSIPSTRCRSLALRVPQSRHNSAVRLLTHSPEEAAQSGRSSDAPKGPVTSLSAIGTCRSRRSAAYGEAGDP